ncbi:WYL domain-containing protein [Arcobacter lacus]|uniref:WYL domain-containing protein n=1 Tax=Arcobacter lacus TaxID=1912876 RepID=UPI0021BB4D88|nr:WYL domain-containing protein [Arcobacter lacus]MCT7911302.1 WYL domain-containing protein [Arcobacter lacus]
MTKEVHLQIDNSAKEYFLRKKVLSNMKIIDQTNEYFIVSTNVAFDDEILNIVKQWIPYIRIVFPFELQNKLQDTLKNYLLKN